jgi:putative FmdB family regulatory protein
MPIYEYKCPEGHITEELRQMFWREQPTMCECGKEAKFIISAPAVQLDGSDPSFPGAHEKWVKQHEKAGKGDDPVNLTHL